MTKSALDGIVKSRPQEPFLPNGRSRRPPNYRDHAEYRQWQAEVKAWEQECTAALRDLYTVVSDQESISLASPAHDQPQRVFTFQDDGTIHGPCWHHPDDQTHYSGWLCPLELPGPRQDIQRWADANRRRQSASYRWPYQPTLPSDLSPDIVKQVKNLINGALASALRSRLNYRALKDLSRIYRPNTKGAIVGLVEYNIAVKSLDALQELHHNGNSGAAGWVIGCIRQLPYWRTKAQRAMLDADRFSLPQTPGQAVTLARWSFQAAGGGNHWKTLVRTPAEYVGTLLHHHSPDEAAWAIGIAAQANLRTSELPLATLLELAQIPRYRRLLMERPHIAKAFRHTALLAVRHYTTQNAEADPEYTELRNAVDYATAEPIPALRRRRWGDLLRASQEWHDILQQHMDRRSSKRNEDITGAHWSGPLQTYRTAQFTARLLDTPEALKAEGQQMRHCIGNSSAYAYACIDGNIRIYHLEPLPDANHIETTLEPTTLERRRNRTGQWSVGQHKAARNHPPAEPQGQWAKALAAACRRAAVADRDETSL